MDWFREHRTITICHTNILRSATEHEFLPYFTRTSFQKTLKNLISSGEYNKTKKTKTPLFCFGSTITCTRFPKFFSEGKPQILPQPYYTSKPGNRGYHIIRTVWMQSFFREVETHVLHYLHSFCDDRELKKLTLLNIELSKKIIPECLRLGISFFTHMSVFCTLNKNDGQMPLHFDERDRISCVFHLGDVKEGGCTLYFDGNSNEEPGKQVYQVPFWHGTLQIGFFNQVLHGVQSWEGQRCGIQMNIKKDLLQHFVKYGTKHYDKYRITGYPQGPIIFY